MGVCIVSEKQHPVGTEVEVHFGLQENQENGKLHMRAVVRHCGAGKIGAEFIDVSPSHRTHWWKIMQGVV